MYSDKKPLFHILLKEYHLLCNHSKLQQRPQSLIMSTRSELRQDAFKIGISILQTAKDPDHILKHSKYIGLTYKLDLHKKYFKQLLMHPKLQPLIAERYAVPWPSLEDMSSMPSGSLGFCMQQRSKELGIDINPLLTFNKSSIKALKSMTAEEYYFGRFEFTHDIHHLILGIPTSVAGEAAFAGYYTMSNQEPGLIALLATWMTHSFINPEEHQIIWRGINFGIQLGLAEIFLQGCRWEEGWERPLAEWRAELGLLELLERSPFQDEVHRWETLSSQRV